MYKHIIWDFDGTLFDTYEVMGKALQMSFADQGIDEPLDEIIRLMKKSISYAIKHYNSKYGIDDVFIKSYEKRRRDMENEACNPYPDVVEVCRYIHSTGRFNYLFTHRGESSIAFLKKHGLYEYFTDCITSQHEFERKPSPEAIHYLIKKYNIKLQEAIMIGDRDLDILSGKNAGIKACFFDVGGVKSEHADLSINSIGQLYSIIK